MGSVVGAGLGAELAEDFAGDGVDDGDFEVADEQDHVGSGVGSSDAEVAEFGREPEGDCVVDDVVADAVVGVGFTGSCGDGFR